MKAASSIRRNGAVSTRALRHYSPRRTYSTPSARRRFSREARSEAAANMIEGTAEPVALPAPEAQFPEATPEPTQKCKTNRLMKEADTAVGPRERKPRMRKVRL